MNLNKKQRAELKMKFGGHCAYCGDQLGDKWHADHLAPIYRGHDENKRYEHRGKDEIENLMPACVSCNLSKSVWSLEMWRDELKAKVERLAPRKDQIICTISDFEADEVRKWIVDFNKTTTVCDSAKIAVKLFIEKNMRGLSDRKMEEEFKLGRNCLKNMVTCGAFYLSGHDKRLRIE